MYEGFSLYRVQEEMTTENKPEEGTVYLSRLFWLSSFKTRRTSSPSDADIVSVGYRACRENG